MSAYVTGHHCTTQYNTEQFDTVRSLPVIRCHCMLDIWMSINIDKWWVLIICVQTNEIFLMKAALVMLS